MRSKWVFVCCLVCLFAGDLASAAVIVVGDHLLLPNTPNQTVQISVTGGDAVQGLNLYAQIADGGPAAGGSLLGPAITDTDILTGTIFAGNNTGSQNPGSLPQVPARTTTTANDTVAAAGLLVTFKIDTTGFTGNASWALNLKDTINGPTDFAGIPITITDGHISIPEPAGMSLLIGFAPLLLRRRV